jgi:hypothetical protein
MAVVARGEAAGAGMGAALRAKMTDHEFH